MTAITLVVVWGSMGDTSYSKDKALSELQEALETAPPWALMPEKEMGRQGSELMEAIQKCALLAESDLRRLVEGYLAAHADSQVAGDEVSAWSKIYVLNRYYFAVPATEERGEVKVFGGWSGMPQEADRLGILWPLEEAPDKSLRITGVLGGYFGPNYRALEEFDFFSTKYGRREERRAAKPLHQKAVPRK